MTILLNFWFESGEQPRSCSVNQNAVINALF
jgi:hypothetical protein